MPGHDELYCLPLPLRHPLLDVGNELLGIEAVHQRVGVGIEQLDRLDFVGWLVHRSKKLLSQPNSVRRRQRSGFGTEMVEECGYAIDSKD